MTIAEMTKAHEAILHTSEMADDDKIRLWACIKEDLKHPSRTLGNLRAQARAGFSYRKINACESHSNTAYTFA